MTLWSIRWSVGKGNHLVAERKVTTANVDEWLRVFRKDEPGVTFMVSDLKPRIPKEYQR